MTEVQQTAADTIEFDGEEHHLYEVTKHVTRTALALGEDGKTAYIVLQLGVEDIGFEVKYLKVEVTDDLSEAAILRLIELW